jgi:hypothetical protein
METGVLTEDFRAEMTVIPVAAAETQDRIAEVRVPMTVALAVAPTALLVSAVQDATALHQVVVTATAKSRSRVVMSAA